MPKAVRHALGLKPGDKVVFEQEGEEVCVRPVRAQSMFAKYRGIGNPALASGRKAVVQKVLIFLRKLEAVALAIRRNASANHGSQHQVGINKYAKIKHGRCH